MMKEWLLTGLCCLSVLSLCAQPDEDPVLMTVNGQPILRSEFIYSYQRNCGTNDGDRLSVSNYLDDFIDYKLKVAAAVTAGYEFSEMLPHQDIPVRREAVTPPDAESCYRRLCTSVGDRDMLHLAQILLRVDTHASSSEVNSVRQRMDSVLHALEGGAVFVELARQVSDDASASCGGDLGWVGPGQLLETIERVAYDLKDGEVSEPFLTPAGWHVLAMLDRRPVTDEVVHQWFLTCPTARRSSAMLPATDENLAREYREGQLVAQVTQQAVAGVPLPSEDELMRYFKKNKKRYGRKLKKRDYPTVREMVLADYLQNRERQWVEGLRRQYKVKVNKSILKTIE